MKKVYLFLLLIFNVNLLTSCTNADVDESLNNDFLYEDILYEDLLLEDKNLEQQLFEIYVSEKLILEQNIKAELIKQDVISEVILLETFYINPNDPYLNYDGAAAYAIFGEKLDVNSLITKTSIGAGAILTVAVVSVLPYSNPISVAVITLARNALPYTIKYATAGTIMGAGIGSILGFTSSIDSTQRLNALATFGLSTAFLIGTIISPPLVGTAFATWGAITAITASSVGFVYSGYNLFEIFIRTDDMKFELDNLDWNQLGYYTAEKAIEGAANGLMIGALSGAVIGAAQSFQRINGKTVLLDNNTFNPNYVDEFGRTNIQRMSSGLAPMGKDGLPVNLHHLDQTNNGAVVEMMQSVHRTNYQKIHKNTGQYPSSIDRPSFNNWRNEYWTWRASTF